MFFKELINTLFAGINAVTVAGWIRGFVAGIWGALGTALIDITGQFTATGQVDWEQAGKTALKVIVPVAIAYLYKADPSSRSSAGSNGSEK